MIVHYSGAGNTFFLIDQRTQPFKLDHMPLLCQRHELDGCILVGHSTVADASMRIFNRDGTEAEMCGNGLRCFIHFLRDLGIEREIYRVETLAGVQKGWFVENEVCVELTPPKDLKLDYSDHLHFLNTGVPHAVCFVEDVETIDVEQQGRSLRHASKFAPAGANVNFVMLRDQYTISIRTYERGVEKETLACGTGAMAAALISSHIHHLSSPINVWVRSGERIKIFFTKNWSNVALIGPVTKLGLVLSTIKDEISILAPL